MKDELETHIDIIVCLYVIYPDIACDKGPAMEIDAFDEIALQISKIILGEHGKNRILDEQVKDHW